MNAKHVLHRLVLIFMFAICSIAVVLFVRQQAKASLSNNINNGVVTAAPTVNGICSWISGTRISTEPAAVDRCSSGTPSSIVKTALGWSWKCTGSGEGKSADCSVTKYVQDIATGPTTAVNAIGTTTTSNTADTVNTANITATDTAASASAGATDDPITNAPDARYSGAPADSTTTSVSETIKSETIVGPSKSDNRSDGSNDRVTAKAEKTEIESDAIAAPVEQQRVEQKQFPAENSSQQTALIEKSPIIVESVVIEAKNLLQDNNPKISGTVGSSLKVEKVVLNKKDDGGKKIALSGKSEPNALVTIYIFSSDPVVITVRADADGNWNYELDKELADGQHEAYVTVADDAGKIVSKSEPIAFIKTAEAATVIPISALEGNQSPMENSVQQFILMAITVMSICLAIALAAVGFLSHKKNSNEGIN